MKTAIVISRFILGLGFVESRGGLQELATPPILEPRNFKEDDSC